jgi:hypothetical protein
MAKTERRISRSDRSERSPLNIGPRAAFAVLGLVLLVSWGSAQSLVEAAKMEKARRARFKGNPSVTITNKDLPRSTYSVTAPDASSRSAEAPETPSFAPSELRSRSSSAPLREDVVRSETQAPAYALRQDDLSSSDAVRIQREWAWQQAKDRADNLEIKIGEYWQEYYASRDQASRQRLEKQIGETAEIYDRAREEEARSWVQMDRLRSRND